eukprot:1000472-Rhodomonas_salina.4
MSYPILTQVVVLPDLFRSTMAVGDWRGGRGEEGGRESRERGGGDGQGGGRERRGRERGKGRRSRRRGRQGGGGGRRSGGGGRGGGGGEWGVRRERRGGRREVNGRPRRGEARGLKWGRGVGWGRRGRKARVLLGSDIGRVNAASVCDGSWRRADRSSGHVPRSSYVLAAGCPVLRSRILLPGCAGVPTRLPP